MKRFNRDYELTIAVGQSRTVVVRPPLRVVFSVEKSVAGGLNKATFRVYNLQESNRLALVRDIEDTSVIPVQMRVGYDGELGMIFKGTVQRGRSFREGPEMVTELECLDGGTQVLGTFVNQTVRGSDKAVDAVRKAAGLDKGKLTTQPPITRPRVLVGSVSRLRDDLVEGGATWYINDEQLFTLKQNEVISRFVPVVNASTGLLNTPSRQMQRVTFDTLMNPALRIGGLCSLESVTAPHMNGVYRIDEIGYSGDNYGSDWSQSLTGVLAGNYEVVR